MLLFLGISCWASIMSQKRRPEDGKPRQEGGSPEDKRRRFKNVVLEVMKLQSIQHMLEPILEPLIRKVVKEEVESALRKHLTSMKQNCGKEAHTSQSRSLQLQFENNLSLPVFTGARIEGEDCSNLRITLVDALMGQVVSSGPESSAKIEIVVLEGDFDSDESDNWSLEEFRNNIVREREGKKPLLTGDAFMNLKDGTGMVGEISFSDNSSWTRSRRFRLGARVVDNFDGTRVKEAKTEPFIVRDHRGELYKKHHPPSLLDEVWRLEKIGKEGAFHKRLSREKINTVKDFLTLLFTDPARLRTIMGTGMSAKMWEVTVEHARTCILDKRRFLYFLPNSQQKTGVVFNVVGQVMGLLSEFQYAPIDKLSEAEKADAHNLVCSAFERWDDVFSFDDEASLMGGSSHLTDVLYTSSSPRAESSSLSKFLPPHEVGGFDYTQPSASSPDIISSIYSVGSSSGLDDYALHGVETTGLRYDHTLSFPGQATNSLICDTPPMVHAFSDEDHLQFFDTDLQSQNHILESQADLQSAVDRFLFARPTAMAVDKVDKAHRRWRKLSSILRWFSIRRIVALRRSHVHDIQRYGIGL
ncbi:Calmodulin binding protein-like [Quillaja saponaria]|uniref:Calmodulin binding protein-like n=1 Tax=Quillaja saponaria TaxID=32244 RepID=A0AAD7P8R3_QUISA|nr:Calmodulin binding protein-like [Quillaja saponaria]